MNSNDAEKFMSDLWAAKARHGERRDCGVRALAAVTGESYEVCRAALKLRGRKHQGGMYTDQLVLALRDMDFIAMPITSYQGRTIRTVARHLPNKGAYVIETARHLAGYREGWTFDDPKLGLHRVTRVFGIGKLLRG